VTAAPATGGPGRVGIGEALRRVVVGYRVVGVVWLWLLAAVVLATEDPRTPVVVGTMALAGVWAAVTVALAGRRPEVLKAWWWWVADVAVAAWVIVSVGVAGALQSFSGGYPFSAVLLAAYTRGLVGSLAAATVLSGVVVGRLGVREASGTVLVFLAGALTTAWGIVVIRRDDKARRALEQRLAEERAERLRSQERAETAAALHDSVLQTLALVQRRADDPAEVVTLARRSERELRGWLGGAGGPGTAAATFAEEIQRVAAEVEAEHRLTVEVVTVGNAPGGEGVAALAGATREALRNVAEHAGVAEASVYAEAGPGGLSVFVRDRGRGFDASAVPSDRRGVAESIVGRVRRHGGTATVGTAPGRGTEVELRLAPPAADATMC
jgi:signal transduction histidine kinase